MLMRLPFLQIEPTTRCNYSCGFCAGRHLPQGDLAAHRLQTLLDGIEGLEHVELQGEGEPLLHAGFFELIDLVRRRFPQVSISTITNGSLFTDDTIERLLDHRLTRVNVSMETADAERFRAIRGGKFERVERGIEAFMRRRAQRGLHQPTVGLAVTVLSDTLNDAADTILPFYRRLQLDGGILLQPLQRMPQYVRFYSREMAAQLPSAQQLQAHNQRTATHGELLQAVQARRQQPGFYERLYGRTAGQPVCPWLENGLFLSHDGALTPCCFVKDSQRFAIGHVNGSLENAERQRRALAGELAQGRIPKACEGCGTARSVSAGALAGQRA